MINVYLEDLKVFAENDVHKITEIIDFLSNQFTIQLNYQLIKD